MFILTTASLAWAEQTDPPEIYSEDTGESVIVHAIGNGYICLYWEDQLVAEGEGEVVWSIPYLEEDYEYFFLATAMEEGKEVSEYTLATIIVPGYCPGPEDPHMTGKWIVLIDKNGEEVWYELHESSDGSWVTTLSLGTDYGIYYYGQDMASRPEVPFRFVVDGVAWGAEEDGMATLMGTILDNPLFETENCYTVPIGYNYNLGILYYDYGYYVYCGQGPEIPGVDPPVVDTERGDVDMDGEVGIADVVALIDYILSHDDTGISLENADCDMDGDIGIADVVALIDYILSKTW